MKTEKWDVFGATAQAVYQGMSAECTWYYDNGYTKTRNMEHYFVGIDLLDESLLSKAQGHVLDVGCGSGRHTIYLQDKGLAVTGIDESPGAVEVCRLRSVKDARLLNVWEVSESHLVVHSLNR